MGKALKFQKANSNRHNIPWIITMGHRPMYCSDFDGDDCTKYESVVDYKKTTFLETSEILDSNGPSIDSWIRAGKVVLRIWRRCGAMGTRAQLREAMAGVQSNCV